MGLFNIRNFLEAQKCAWFKRSVNLNEPWKVRLYIGGFCNLFNVKSQNICKEEFPICHGICKSFERVSNAFTLSNENFRRCYIFENEKITVNLDSKAVLSRNMFSAEFFEQNAARLYRLRYNDFYDHNDTLIPEELIYESTGLQLSMLHIFRIRGACMVAKTKFNKKEVKNKKKLGIENLILCKKKGSSHIRRLLSCSTVDETPHNIVKFASNIDVVISGEQSKILTSLWTLDFISNQDKTFFFKLYNNILGYNNAVAHFVRGHTPYCTFCNISESLEPHYETPPLCLFLEFPTVIFIVENIFKLITRDNDFEFSRR